MCLVSSSLTSCFATKTEQLDTTEIPSNLSFHCLLSADIEHCFGYTTTLYEPRAIAMFTPKSKAAQGAGFGTGFGGFSTSSTTLSYLSPPPDFSAIPHEVVVPFKNLLKKASTTKEKALQDILAYVQGLGPEGQLDESVVDTYVCWRHAAARPCTQF